jgi:hypothetical protein
VESGRARGWGERISQQKWTMSGLASDEPIARDRGRPDQFPGADSARGLRRAVEKGERKAFKVGRKIFTTPANIANMRESCRVERSRLASISIQR